MLTAFNVQSYTLLQQAPTDSALALLQQISAQLDSFLVNPSFVNNTRPARSLDEIQPASRPPSSAVWINALFFSSLICSLGSASIALIVKQWLHELSSGLSGTSRESARLRQYRLNGLLKWHVGTMVLVPSILLQIALIMFLAGLVILLWTLNTAVAALASALMGSLVVYLSIVTVLPVFRWDCFYRHPLALLAYVAARAVRNGTRNFFIRFTRTLYNMCKIKLLDNLSDWFRFTHEMPTWRGREQSDISRTTGTLDRSIAAMAYTTTFSTRHLETLHTILSDLPEEELGPCFDDIFSAWERHWGHGARRHRTSIQREHLGRPLIYALRKMLTIDYKDLGTIKDQQLAFQLGRLLDRFMPSAALSDVDVCLTTLSALTASEASPSQSAFFALEQQLETYRLDGIRLTYRAIDTGQSSLHFAG